MSPLNSTISIKLEVKYHRTSISILNIYVPYFDRVSYWKILADSGTLNDPIILFGRDMNLTLPLTKFWESITREYV
jgi:hypothetical protein